MLPWCQSLFIYFKGKHHCRPRLYFQKNPISKATTLLLIHGFQPLAAWTPERKNQAPPRSAQNTHSPFVKRSNDGLSLQGASRKTLWKWFNCPVRSAEAHSLAASAKHLPSAKSLAVSPPRNKAGGACKLALTVKIIFQEKMAPWYIYCQALSATPSLWGWWKYVWYISHPLFNIAHVKQMSHSHVSANANYIQPTLVQPH